MTYENTANPSQPRPLALVTGASSGIGLELAREFARKGYDLLVAAEDEAVHEAARELSVAGCEAVAQQVDLATSDGVAQLYAVAAGSGRAVTAAALNAGVAVGGRFHETDVNADLRLVALNVASTVHLAKLLTRDMVKEGEGKLLFTASIASTMPGPYHATYAASKAFVHSFAEAIRVELKDTGVTVTSLMPGPTDTNFFERANMEDTRIASAPKDDPADVARRGVEALLAGKDHVVAASRLNKLQTAAGQLLPDRLVAAVQGRLTKPGSGRG